MIDISLTKLLLLAVVALIVLGPERLPHAARTAGALLRRMRNGWDSVRAEVEREIQAEEIKRTLRETAENARATHESVRDDVRAAGAEIRGASERIRDTFTETQTARAAGREPDPALDMLPLKRGEPVPPENETHDRT
ncbi:twin-arginine translocase subunit TatB [Luteibacter flocculans]|uniref:Sec-independent protein translocase protein TatB n=1 Tax=Luteibacter flocculans TaxID=2780091 RepID=A0ABY4T4R5_9GAMM|nr:Sec-independent protein translocase protein TatB [Luteibacter flocculans]URL58903.1 twin-arginine translocase subunit TatB [Luteibacter flocculans]